MSSIIDFVLQIVDQLGYVGLAAVIALENVFPPIPSEAILPLAGFNVQQGDFSFGLVLLAATIGSVVGALILYGLGAWLGEHRVRWLVNKYGQFAFLKESDVDTAKSWFIKHGPLAVLICRMIPLVRSLISIPAGIERMPLPVFLLYTTVGSAIWNLVLVGAGWALGSQWDIVERYVDVFQYLVIAAIVIAVAWFVWKRLGARSARVIR